MPKPAARGTRLALGGTVMPLSVWGGTGVADDPMLGRVIGGHKIIESIGAGGMGAVYRAVHVGLGQTRAIKLLPPALASDPVLVERFKREARTAASLRHPNVVQIYDVGSEDGTHYIVMALVSGRSLLALLRSEPLLSYLRVARILRQLAAALDAAHRASIVHRDVKSANVIVGDDDHVTLVDFGIASVLEATRLTVLASPGTPSYMSPEQVRREPAGPGFDLYALGVVAYEMLTGRLPFLGDPLAVVLAHRDETPPPPRAFRPTLPPAVDDVLIRQLAKSPQHRYPTGGAFVTALDGALMSTSPSTTFGNTATTITTTTTTTASAPGPSVPPMQPRVAAPIPGPPTPNPSGPAAVRTSGRRATPVFGVVLAVGLVLAAVGYGGVFGLRLPGSALPGTVTPTPDVGASQFIITPDAPRPVTLTVPPTDVPTREPTPTRVLTPTPTPPPKIVPENVERIVELRNSNHGLVVDMAFAADGQFFASGTADGPTRLWRASDGAPIEVLDGHTDTVWRVAISPDSQTIATGSQDKSMRLWRASDGAPLRVLTGHASPVWGVAFSPDGQTVASGSSDGSIRLWRVGDGSPLRTLAGHTPHAVASLAFSPDGQTLASGSQDDTVRLWRTSDGALLHTLTGHTDDVLIVAFSPNGQAVASGSQDRAVRLWRSSDGSPLRTLNGHTTGVTTVAFSPDGETLVSGSLDYTVRFWRARDGSLLRTIARHLVGLKTVAFSPDGQTVASASTDGSVKFWGVRDTPPPSPSPAARPAPSPAAKPAGS